MRSASSCGVQGSETSLPAFAVRSASASNLNVEPQFGARSVRSRCWRAVSIQHPHCVILLRICNTATLRNTGMIRLLGYRLSRTCD
jgi:hypothetical protein